MKPLEAVALVRSAALGEGVVLNDDEAWAVLWNETGWPAFFTNSPRADVSVQTRTWARALLASPNETSEQ